MSENTQELDKIKKLAAWSTRYRNGTKEMIEDGWDPEELDDAVEAAETVLAQENREKQKAMRHRRAVRSF
jgi:hypothetical protein